MNLIRSILAALFAIAIANPACCCTVRKAEEVGNFSHCCGGTKKEKQLPEHCACPAKSVKQLEDPPALPVFKAIELPPVLPSLEALLIPEVPSREVAPVDFRSDTGPPLRRLAVLQRFLI
jgi:hypothetical protein